MRFPFAQRTRCNIPSMMSPMFLVFVLAAWSWGGRPLVKAQEVSSCKSKTNCKDCLGLSCSWYGWLAGCQETSHKVKGFHSYSSTATDLAEQVCQRASDCEVAGDSCEECLEASCIWYGKGTCIDSSATNIPENQLLYQLDGPGKTSSSVCAQHAQDQQADRLCRTKTNCAECTGTSISDDGTCLWYEQSGYCRAHGNGESHCGECANRSYDMNMCYIVGKVTKDICEQTPLADGVHFCEWDESMLSTCEPSTCKHGQPLRTADQQEDATLCSLPTDCATCQETLLTDSRSTCVWYEPVLLKPGEETTALCGYPGEYETVCHDCSNCHPPMPEEGFPLLDGSEGTTATSDAPMDRTCGLLLGGLLVWVSVLELPM